jgi:hypothetical protein
MTASLTPALALAYLRELSLDVRAAVVLDPEGRPLVGDRTLASAACQLLAGSDARSVADGGLRVARTPDGGAIAALAGDLVLAPLLEHDLGSVAEGLVTAPADLPGT